MFGFMAKLPTVPAFNIVTMMTLFIRVASLIAIPAARLAYSRFIWRLPPFGGVGMRVLVIHERPWFATLSLTVRSASVGVWPRVLDMVTSWGLRMMRSDLIILLMTCVMARAPDVPGGCCDHDQNVRSVRADAQHHQCHVADGGVGCCRAWMAGRVFLGPDGQGLSTIV